MSDRPDEHFKHGDLRSFGRRRTRSLTVRQSELLTELLPRCRIDPTAPPTTDTKQHLFADRAGEPAIRQIWLEIGFGGGEHLIWQAARNPDVGYIGCEPFIDGVVKVLGAIASDALTNVRLYDGDARDVLRWLQPGSIDRAFVLFPDPWPKKRHNKRRLVNPATLALLAEALRPGAELRIGTDIADYARTILLAFRQSPQFSWLAERPTDWRVRPDDWPQTRYEAKAHREGRTCYYLRFHRN